jgi:hypothetical protein
MKTIPFMGYFPKGHVPASNFQCFYSSSIALPGSYETGNEVAHVCHAKSW